MQTENLRKNRKNLYYVSISASLLLFLLISPLSTFAQSPDSIATLRQMGKAFASIAEKASPAVVSIQAERTVVREYSSSPNLPFGDPFNEDFFNYFFRRPSPRQNPQQRRYREPETRMAQGSGFIISSDGYILTNNHVVDEAQKVEVELTNGQKYTAKIIGTDPDSDVAVIKIDAGNVSHLELDNSDKLEVGEWVLAIGNPLGLSHTVTAGIVSAKGRSGFGLAALENFIQTDAAINFGNSGGPLINLDGKVIGINTAIAGSTGNIGIGFAIPINMAKYAYEQIVASGTVERGLLGVRPQTLDADKAEALGLKDVKGVLIPEVSPDSAAEKAGLTHNDIILEVNGEPVETDYDLRNRIAMLKPGTKVDLTIWRDEKRKIVTVELGKRSSLDVPDGTMSADTVQALGFTVENLTEELAQQFGYEGMTGVIVTQVEPGSEADRNAIAPGTLIREIDKQQIKNVRQFNKAIESAKKQGRTLLLVNREGQNFFVLLKLSE